MKTFYPVRIVYLKKACPKCQRMTDTIVTADREAREARQAWWRRWIRRILSLFKRREVPKQAFIGYPNNTVCDFCGRYAE